MTDSKAKLPEGAMDLMKEVAKVLLTSSVESPETWDKLTKLIPQLPHLLQAKDGRGIEEKLLQVVKGTIESPDVFGRFLCNLSQEARQSLMDRMESVFRQEFSRLNR